MGPKRVRPNKAPRLTASEKRARTKVAIEVFSEGLMRQAILTHLDPEEKALAIFGFMYNGYIFRETARTEFLHHLVVSARAGVWGCHEPDSIDMDGITAMHLMLKGDIDMGSREPKEAIRAYLPAVRHVPVAAMRAVKLKMIPKVRMKELKTELRKNGAKLGRIPTSVRAKYMELWRRDQS